MSRWTSFVARLREVVVRIPDRPAVIVGGTTALTYRDLWALSGRVAHGLQQAGVGPECVVGIRLEKSAEFIATMIGIWRTRAAYLPLDPQTPLTRLRLMVQDAEAALAIVRNQSPDKDDLSIPSLTWDDLIRHGGLPDEIAPDEPTPEDLAWVIFTSGTTGQPRGVAVEQRGFVALLDAQRIAFDMDEFSRSLAFYSTAFDAFLSDLGTTLLSGAALCIEDPSLLHGSVLKVIGDRRITHADLPPSLVALLDPADAPDCLRNIMIGGEVCPAEVVRRWARRVNVVNVYGPTEATVCSSLCPCDADTWDRPLLGRPIPGVAYLVVDGDGALVSLGEEGELLIGGPCLARGYVNRSAETAAKFIWRDGGRYYRTGDRVRLDHDGEFVFRGRLDRQIKLRGLRIELEEIEAALSRVPGIRRAAVVPRKLGSSGRRDQLVAFVESDGIGLEKQIPAKRPSSPASGGRQPSDCSERDLSKPDGPEQQIIAALKTSLPEWMIPARVVVLAQLPVTASNKIDLEALRVHPLTDPQVGRMESGTDVPLAAKLHLVFQAVLGIDRIGLDDDFFLHGGDSLGVFEVVAAARKIDVEIPPTVVATERTIRRICRRLGSGAAIGDGADAPEHVGENAGSIHYVTNSDNLSAEWLLDNIQDEITAITRLATSQGPAGLDPAELHGASSVMLLTGATGFLGTRVLQQWLDQFTGEVVCLVRAPNDAAAGRRLREALHSQQVHLEQSELARVSIVAGDLAAPRFGWPTDRWQHLAGNVTGVVHCAARVNVIDDYATLRSDNVTGTFHVLQFVATRRAKRLWYASTLSVFVGTDRHTGLMREDDDLTHTARVYGGYAQSKWAAEMLVRRCGLPDDQVRIIRFGLLTGDTRSGIVPEQDLLTMTLRGLIRLGCVPHPIPGLKMDMTPVDFAAAALVHLALAEGHVTPHPGAAWHIANPESLAAETLFNHLRTIRPDLEPVAPDEFQRRLRLQDDPQTAAACLGLSRWLETADKWSAARTIDLFEATGAEFEMTRTLRLLATSELHCPPPEEALIDKYIRRILQERGTDYTPHGHPSPSPPITERGAMKSVPDSQQFSP